MVHAVMYEYLLKDIYIFDNAIHPAKYIIHYEQYQDNIIPYFQLNKQYSPSRCIILLFISPSNFLSLLKWYKILFPLILNNPMNFLSIFGAGKSQKKKKKNKRSDRVESEIYALKSVTMRVSSLMGSGPKKQECQDTCCMLENLGNDTYFFAVYDGHGSSGREASQTANDYISSELQKSSHKGDLAKLQSEKDVENYLSKVFKNAEKKLKSSGIDYSSSGTCAISVFIQGNKCYIANLGDSRAVLFRSTLKEKLAIELSYDHKPIRPDERERIQKSGGKIYRLTHEGQQVGPPRVWADEEGPGIAITRSLGDLQAKRIGLISEPEIQNLELQESDRFIVIGSDGCWDVMSSAEVCGFVEQHEDRETAASALVNECKARWQENNRNKKNASKIGDLPYLKFGRDDISVVIAYLEFKPVQADPNDE